MTPPMPARGAKIEPPPPDPTNPTAGDPCLPSSPPSPVDWRGTKRYEVIRQIGRGGMGVVYEARDVERGRRVALKTLLHLDAGSLYQFKQEFRALAGVTHKNLVRLHELVATEGDRVFFAMELVRGTDFLGYVQRTGALPRPHRSAGYSSDEHARSGTHLVGAESPPETTRERVASPADLDLLLPALRQLARGVQALHAAGKLHRDIKPSNVLVTTEGRVVLLDFGVATEFRVRVGEDAEDQPMAGTAAYMAPEQAFPGALTPAADWYAFGVMLYEALVGAVPFTGGLFELIETKNLVDPEPPSNLVEGVPPELEALCLAMLRRSPEERPSGTEILQRLGAGDAPQGAPPATAVETTTLVGREPQLRALSAALERTRIDPTGRCVAVRVSGRSGMGKSALVEHFLDGIGGDAIVMRGRVDERESLPYKAVDRVVDGLSRVLARLCDDEESFALPAGIGALAQLFPVLRRVPAVGALPPERSADPRITRRRAFVALRELLSTIGRRVPLVLYIDDAQWGDTDSTALLLDLVRPPEPPAILLLLAHREENAASSAFLTELRMRWPVGAEISDIAVGPLDEASSRALALSHLADSDLKAQLADAVARESGGSPFLIGELSRHAAGEDLLASETRITIEQLVAQRTLELPDTARRLAEIVAVGGRPMPLSILGEAAGVAAVDDVVSLLSERRFVRLGLRDGREVAEPIHDRIRETIVAHLPPALLREHHARLARVLENTRGTDPEAVAIHWLGAGETERGGQFALRAAEQATELLAFDQAARLFRLAIETFPADSPKLGKLYARLGELLEWAGRNEAAGRAYLAASERAAGSQRTAFERAASLQLIAAGRVEEGGEILGRILAGMGIDTPASIEAANAAFIDYQAALGRRGLHFQERPAAEVAATDLARLDALHVAALAHAQIDATLSHCMQAREFLEALDAGDRSRALRSAITYFSSALGLRMGGPDSEHERGVRTLIQHLLGASPTPEELGYVGAADGLRHFLRGRWREAVETLDAACAAVPAQQAAVQSRWAVHAAYALGYLGDLHELRRRTERIVTEARDRADLFAEVSLRLSTGSLMRLAADEPEAARAEIRAAAGQWTHGKYLVQHLQVMRSETEIDLYAGNGLSAYRRFERDAEALKDNPITHLPFMGGLLYFLQARIAIAAADAGERVEVHLAKAREHAQWLGAQAMAWTDVFAAMVDASIKSFAPDRAATAEALRESIERAERANMAMYAAAARHRLGLLLGQAGAALLAQAEDAMRAQDIVAPDRFAAMYLPGRWTESSAPGK